MSTREIRSLARTFAVGFILILAFGFIVYGVTAFWIGAAVAVPAGVTYGKWLRYQSHR